MRLPRRNAGRGSGIIDSITEMLGTIYDAIDDDDVWSDAFRHIAEATRSRTAGMFRVDGMQIGFERSWNMPHEFMAEFGRDYVGGDPRVARALAHPVGTILSDADPDVRRGMVRSGIDELARHYDMPYTLASMFRRDNSGLWGLYVSRSEQEGAPDTEQFARFEFVLRHIQRAISLRLQLAEARLQMQLAGAQSGGEPPALILVDRKRRLRWAGPIAENLLRTSTHVVLDRGALRLADARMDRMLQRALCAAAHGEAALRLQLPAEAGVTACVSRTVEVLPYRGEGWLAAREPMFLLVIRFRTADLRVAMDLSPRQHAVLGLLAEGLSNREIAARLSLSVNTVRNHLQGLFERLDAHNRTECVAQARKAGVLPPTG
jgi:DNA-binding CsgD family transcriptional regulator